jgi:tRNA(Ile)-lysidine synthase
MFAGKISAILSNNCMLTKDRPVLVGVSGGPDSLSLLMMLQDLGYPMVIAHFNHQIRPEALNDARYVEKIATNLGLPFVCGSSDVPNYANSLHVPIEEAARELRYRFLFDQARIYSAQAVAVGHTADDQVETVLMHILRGSGLKGLRGMSYRTDSSQWDQDIPLIRPLLSTWRKETQDYCTQMGFSPVNDATNTDRSYLRNRIRLDLIPDLEKYNPRFRKAIIRMARILDDDFQVLEQDIQSAWKNCCVADGDGYVALNRDIFLKAVTGIQRGVLQKIITDLVTGNKDIEFDSIERILGYIKQKQLKEYYLGEYDLRLLTEEYSIYLYREGSRIPDNNWPQLYDSSPVFLQVPGSIQISPTWKIESTLIINKIPEILKICNSNHDLFQVWLDADCISESLIIKARADGDSWKPLGLEQGYQKLSDFFINEKCPLRARDRWPIICSGNEIIWIPGYRPGNTVKITQKTSRILYLKISSTDPN